MKTLLSIALLLIGGVAAAVPIVNENVANFGVITIYPDHADPNRFYVAPNVVTIGIDAQGLPIASYHEYTSIEGYSRALLQMTMTAAYTREEFEAAKNAILAKNPAAQFSGVPFVGSRLVLNGQIKDLIKQNECNHIAGLIGQEQSCTLLLNLRGRNAFRDAVRKKKVFLHLQFEYTVKAFTKNAAGGLDNFDLTHGIAARISGEQLSKVPDLLKK